MTDTVNQTQETVNTQETVQSNVQETAPVQEAQTQVQKQNIQEQNQEQAKPERLDAVGDLFNKQAQTENQVPEKYEFVDEQGQELPSEIYNDYSNLAREMGMSQDNAQRFYQTTQNFLQSRMLQNNNEWVKATRNDVELGGNNLAKTRENFKTALDRFATPEFKQFLQNAGIVNHPELIRFISRVGASMTSDNNFINGKNPQTVKHDPYGYMDKSPELH